MDFSGTSDQGVREWMVRFGYAFDFPIEASPRAFFSREAAFGQAKASALEVIFRSHAEEDIRQNLRNAMAEAGVYAEHESGREYSLFMANALVLRRLPAPINPA